MFDIWQVTERNDINSEINILQVFGENDSNIENSL